MPGAALSLGSSAVSVVSLLSASLLSASLSSSMIARALTIAGSDPSGGAGIQADLKTFTVFEVFGMSVITALTAQNTLGVSGIHTVPAPFVRQQIDAVASDIGVDAAKTGMLANAEIIAVVAQAIREHRIQPVVVDPVMAAQSGAALVAGDARDTLTRELLPVATLITPNIHEAEVLTGLTIQSLADMRRAARLRVESSSVTSLRLIFLRNFFAFCKRVVAHAAFAYKLG
jgi:hydroxymethylpyrimidine kinase/phosphomethylpyrimidine kinase